MKKVFIIILNYNGWENTEECLKSLGKLEVGDWELEIVVVDNGSEKSISHAEFILASNKILNQVQNDKLKTKIIQNKENLGYAEGNNVGIKYALENGADYIMLLNSDTLVHKNLIDELLKTMERDKKIGIAGPKIYFAPGFEFHKDRYRENEKGKVFWYAGGIIDWQNLLASHRGVDEVDHGQYGKKEETDFISGCCMMIKREVLEKIGFFDENYFLYWEDNDFCQRLRRKGFKVVYAPKAIIWHKNAGSGGGSGSNLQDYYITRNRLLFGFKYAPLKTKLALIKESIKLLIGGRQWQRQGIIDFYQRRFGKGSFNL